MFARYFFFVILILFYSVIFSFHDRTSQAYPVLLKSTLPVNFHKVASGYLKQLTTEILFIKTSVFLGGVKAGMPEKSYMSPLAANFHVMTKLYPEFIDPYFFTQSFLAPISNEGALLANAILETGIQTYPDNFIFRFFHAFNKYNYLDAPLEAAKDFQEAANKPNAPPIFAHLAALFSAKGGDIATGLIMLKTIAASEENHIVKQKYEEEIKIYEKALTVERAIAAYKKRFSAPPTQLENLMPDFLPRLPDMGNLFTLHWDRKKLSLVRLPQKAKPNKSK